MVGGRRENLGILISSVFLADVHENRTFRESTVVVRSPMENCSWGRAEILNIGALPYQ